MKQKINRNTLWCEVFANHIAECGIRNVCISPGSRSTPLTLAFSRNKFFKIFPIVDERSSGFFALGLAKSSNTPTLVITTSGTAVAELYPAIIEAYYQRVPLIICTADRPAYLRNQGANQTINQENIYGNHIRYFADAGLPQLNHSGLKRLKSITGRAIRISRFVNPGPVHINFPFEKPFEPDSYTDTVSSDLLKEFKATDHKEITIKQNNTEAIQSFADTVKRKRKGIIICGFNNYGIEFISSLIKFSFKSGYPIFADGTSGLRNGPHSKSNIIENFNALIRSDLFLKKFDPELILQVGGAATSNPVHDFIKSSKAEKILINEYGDRNDPSLSAKKLIRISPLKLFNSANLLLKDYKVNKDWLRPIAELNNKLNDLKTQLFDNQSIFYEPVIIHTLIKNLPDNCNLMISNSLPIRDFDFFSTCSKKRIFVYINRGASGIDGINSTALGIAANSSRPTFLVTGDLAFFHDLNGLHNSLKFKIPLTIILINNSGGGIFESLPISRFGKIFRDNFSTPLKLEFEKIVKAFNGIYYIVGESKGFIKTLGKSSKNRNLCVIEIRTDARLSKIFRSDFWETATGEIEKYINDNSG